MEWLLGNLLECVVNLDWEFRRGKRKLLLRSHSDRRSIVYYRLRIVDYYRVCVRVLALTACAEVSGTVACGKKSSNQFRYRKIHLNSKRISSRTCEQHKRNTFYWVAYVILRVSFIFLSLNGEPNISGAAGSPAPRRWLLKFHSLSNW